MEEKKQYSTLTIDRAAFLLLRVKKAFKKKRMQRKEREKSAQLSASVRVDQRASCAGLESSTRTGVRKPPPLLRSRTLPAIVVPGVSIIQAQLGNYTQEAEKKPTKPTSLTSRFHSTRVSFCSKDDNTATTTMDRRKSAISRLCGSGNYGPDRHTDGTLLLHVPAPHVVAARAYSITSPNSGHTAFYRLSRLLSQTPKSEIMIDDSNVPRRLSWERRDTINSRLPRSASIDSMVEAVWAESIADSARTTIEKRPSLRTERTLGLVSPSVGRRMKGQRATNELPTLSSECDSMEVATQFAAPLRRPTTGGGLPPSSMMMPPAPPPPAPPSTGHSTSSKSSKKQVKLMQQRLERLARINIHLHALFAAVEHGHLEKARTILESTDVDVNSVNNDGLSPLDVAVLSNNRPLMKMLVGFGAKEGGQFSSPEKLGAHLKHLLGEAEMRLQELGGLLEEPCVTPLNTRASFSSMIGSAYPSSTITGCAGGDNDKQALAWGRRAKMMKRLVLGFAQARPPDPPSLVAVDITAQQSVSLRLQEPVSSDSPMTTKFKVQWSTRPDFSPITGELEITDLEKPNCIIDLTQGRRYFFRAASGNVKRYGIYVSSTPTSVVPSSWRDLEDKDIRFAGRQRELDDLTAEVRLLRPDSEMLEPSAYPPVPSVLQQQQQNQQQPPVQQQRRPTRKKTTIKQLFTAASRFQKHLRRGCHLACVLYHEDKVLVTNEDFLPVIEIDETYPSSLHTDVHWLMKVACTWDDTKSLRVDMDKHASSAIHFRTKLLAAAMQMQSALCLQDLGQLYHRALRDSQGTVVLSTINYVKNPKSVSVLNSRWLPLNKLFKKCLLGDDHSVAEMLMASIQDQINYHQVSALTLGKGLYLTYLKLQSSVDTIQVVVPAKSPNILPHCKIRDNPHVSAEEWEYLKHYTTFPPNAANEQQRTFLELITSAARRLFNYMDLPPEDALNHRLYDTEVIDLSGEVSCIIVCPAAEYSCSVPGQRELLLQRGDLLSLPVQVYEMIHIGTYHRHLMQRYAKLSCLLELDAATASHLHREAFSNAEVAVAKDRLNKLHDLQNRLGVIWRCMRWLMDAITFSRDRNSTGIPMRILLDRVDLPPTTPHPLTDYPTTPPKHSLLQIPPSNKGSHMTPSGGSGSAKSTPGRGSWPGPSGATPAPHHHLHHGGGSGGGLLTTEFSKSEQHLYIASSTSQELGMNGGGEEEMERSDQVHQLDATSLSNNTSQYLSACCSSDGESPRKSSDASDYFNECCRQPDRIEGPLVEGVQPGVSRSEDMLYVIPPYHPCKHQQSQARIRSNTVSSISATTSPLLNVRPLYTGSLLSVNTINTTNTSDSMHSLSSDSDNGFGCSTPLGSSTPHKAHKSKMLPSRSMTNVKHNVQLDSSTRSERYTTQRPRHLNVEPFVPSNLDTSLSKSLSNIKNLVESDYDQRTYLKPVAERTTVQDQDPTFKVPYSEPTPGTSISSGSSNVTPNPSCTTSVAPGGKSAPNGDNGNSGILQVYAAYDTGLATGTSLKLHVTPRTTAREVVDLVVKQLNMAVVLKGKDGPIYSPDRLRNFCLVAVIGARERCLRDDFKPLQLQNPWKKGRLYVRQKQDVLAALEHSSKHSAII